MKYRYNRWRSGDYNSFVKFMLSKEMFVDADMNKFEYYMNVWRNQNE